MKPDVELSVFEDTNKGGGRLMRLVNMDIHACSESDVVSAVKDASQNCRTNFTEEDLLREEDERKNKYAEETAREKAEMRKERKSNIKDYIKVGTKASLVYVGVYTAAYSLFSIIKKLGEIDGKLDSSKK